MRSVREEARGEIRAAVRRMVINAGGEMILRPVFRDRPDLGSSAFTEPEPLAGIRAAASLQFEAGQAISSAARDAREDGLSWDQIGQALSPAEPAEDEEPRAVRAFDRLATSYSEWESPTFTWTCPACLKRISDYGPEADGHPTEIERGHSDDCTRIAEAIGVYEAWWEDDE